MLIMCNSACSHTHRGEKGSHQKRYFRLKIRLLYQTANYQNFYNKNVLIVVTESRTIYHTHSIVHMCVSDDPSEYQAVVNHNDTGVKNKFDKRDKRDKINSPMF